MLSEKNKEKALATLSGMARIIRNERLIRGEYVSDEVDPDQVGAICSGRKYCLLGSAWVSYGVKPKVDGYVVDLPGVEHCEREDFLRNRPALKAVYDALNTAAERRDLSYMASRWESPAEGYFEEDDPGRTALLRLVSSARKIIEKA